MKNNLVRAPFYYLTFLACAALVCCALAAPSYAKLQVLAGGPLNFWQSTDLPDEDIVYAVDAYYGVFVDTVNNNQLKFCKFKLDGTGFARDPVTFSGGPYWQPSICWDGTNFAIAYSTLVQAEFMVVSPEGNIIIGPIVLPGIQTPIKKRSTAFKVYWTGSGYGVFGLSGTEAGYGFYDTYLYYWLIDISGNVIVPGKQICQVPPITVPQASEMYIYDAVWNGSAFFLAYGNHDTPASPTLYRMTDLYGNTVRNEAVAFPSIPAEMYRVAWSVTSFAIAGRWTSSDGTRCAIVTRFFSQTGEPLGAETTITSMNLFPHPATVSWDGEKFVAAQAGPYIPAGTNYSTAVYITTFSAQGALIDNEYVLFVYPWDSGGASFGDNLKMVGCGKDLFFQGAWGGPSDVLSISPLVYWVTGDSSVVPTPMPPPVPLTTPTPAQPPSTIPTAVNELNGTSFGVGDQITATFKVNIAITRPFNVYAVIIMPGGSMIDAMTLSPKLKPAATNVSGLPAGFSRQLFSTRVPASAPKGEYELVVALFDLNTKIKSRADAFLDVSAKFTIR